MNMLMARRRRRVDAHHADTRSLQALRCELLALGHRRSRRYDYRGDDFQLFGANDEIEPLPGNLARQLFALARRRRDIEHVLQRHAREYFMVGQPGPEHVIKQSGALR